MNFSKIFSLIALSLILIMLVSSTVSAAVSVSQNIKQDYVRVKERWSYTEDTTGKLRGFNLVHIFYMPKETITVNARDSGNTQTTTTTTVGRVGQGFGRSSGSSGFGSGVVGSNMGSSRSFGSAGIGSDRAVSDAFDTFQRNSYSSGRNANSGSVRFRIGF
jgi:hypothetical protein